MATHHHHHHHRQRRIEQEGGPMSAAEGELGATPLWEKSKENAAPLERGRNVSVLERSIAAAMETSNANQEERRSKDRQLQYFELLIQPLEEQARESEEDRRGGGGGGEARGEYAYHPDFNHSDPLVHWLSYIKYQQDTYPSDTYRRFLLLERCFRSMVFHNGGQYADDPRFVRICCSYADKTKDDGRAHEIFQYLYRNRIGLQTNAFWAAWAFTSERAGNYKRADEIFVKGLQVRSSSASSSSNRQWLENRHKQFLRRMSRHFLNNSVDADEENGDVDDAGRRALLGSLSEEAFRRNDRSAASAAAPLHIPRQRQQQQLPPGPSSAAGLSTFTDSRSRRRQAMGGAEGRGGRISANVPATDTFAIFVDGDENSNSNNDDGGGDGIFLGGAGGGISSAAYPPHGGSQIPGGGGLDRRLEREEERLKENNLAAEPWNQRGGFIPQYSAPGSTARLEGDPAPHHYRYPPHTQPAASFDVFVDEECEERARSEAAARAQHEQWQRLQRDERTFRERRDHGAGMSVAERLADDPLRYVRDPSQVDADLLQQRQEQQKVAEEEAEEVAAAASARAAAASSAPVSVSRRLLVTSTAAVTTKASAAGGHRSSKSRRDKKPPPTIANPAFRLDLLVNPRDGEEQCFEEGRGQAGYYSLVSASTNFNNLSCPRREESDVSMETSIEEVSMEEVDENLDCASKNASGPPANDWSCNESRSQRSRVNSSFDRLTPRNASTASSTVDEAIAVGAPTGKEEQTINTQWALKELSMMFSSPAVPPGEDSSCSDSATATGRNHGAFMNRSGGDLGPILNESGVSETAAEEIVEDGGKFMESDESRGVESSYRRPTFQIYCDDGEAADEGKKESSSAGRKPTFQIYNDDDDSPTESSFCENGPKRKKAQPKFNVGDTASLGDIAELLGDYCDEEERAEGETKGPASHPVQPAASAPTFQIYNDAQESPRVAVAREKETAPSAKLSIGDTAKLEDIAGLFAENDGPGRSSFQIYNDQQESSQEAVARRGKKKMPSIGDTAKLEDIAELFSNNDRDEDGAGEKKSVPGLGEAFDDLGLTDSGEDSSSRGWTCDVSKMKATDSDKSDILPPFGDVSCIEEEATSTFGHNLMVACAKAIDYIEVHRLEIQMATERVKSNAHGHLGTGCLSKALATKRLICDCPTEVIPRKFKLKELDAGKEKIKIGRCSGEAQELGRGAYGVVALLEASSGKDRGTIAVKVQKPVGSLAFEYDLMEKIEQRVGCRFDSSSAPAFPSPLSFVFLADGALLGMTACSRSGLNLVDLVNIHQLRLGGYVPEILALHYTARMLHHIEILHWHGKILHCDVKPDNWVLTPSSEFTGSTVEASDLTLVDFGRAIDLESAAASRNRSSTGEAKLVGEASSPEMMCVAMRQSMPWSFDIDTFGVCAAAHVLLSGKHIEIEKNETTKRWMPKEKFKDYHQRGLWESLFDTLLNLDDISMTAIGSHPKCVRELREKLESLLRSRQDELEKALREQATKIPRRRAEIL